MGRIISDWYVPELDEDPNLKKFMKEETPDNIWFIVESTCAGNRKTIYVWKAKKEFANIPASPYMLAEAVAEPLGEVHLVLAFKRRSNVKQKLMKILKRNGVIK